MDREQAEHVLRPIWIGFAAAEGRLEALLAESKATPVDRENVVRRIHHEAELEEALDYLRARSRAFVGYGLMTAVDTGRAVHLWPHIYPSHEAAAHAVETWRAARAKKAALVVPLDVSA